MKVVNYIAKISLLSAAIMLSVIIISSCIDNNNGMHSYSFTFSETTPNASTAEKQQILKAYRKAIGFTGYEISITGSDKQCISTITAGCQKAEAILSGQDFDGGFVIDVVKRTDLKTIYTHSYGSLAKE